MENKCFKIEVGQEVVLRPTGNNLRSWDGKPVHGRISKIARKYFYVSVNGHTWSDERFFIEDFAHDDGDTNAGYEIFESEAEYQKAVDYEVMLLKVRRYFSGYGNDRPPYETMKKIHDLLSYEDLI